MTKVWSIILYKCMKFDWNPGTDEEEVILNAFAQYDEGNGLCNEETYVHSEYDCKFICNNWLNL